MWIILTDQKRLQSFNPEVAYEVTMKKEIDTEEE